MGTDHGETTSDSSATDHGDVLIKGGTVFDGSGQRPGLQADVLVRDGIIAQIGIDLVAPDDAEVIDASHLEVGRRADIVIVDPTTLDERLDNIEEVEMIGMPGLNRLVRRHDDCTPAVLINGRVAWRDGQLTEGFGDQAGYGAVLRATV